MEMTLNRGSPFLVPLPSIRSNFSDEVFLFVAFCSD